MAATSVDYRKDLRFIRKQGPFYDCVTQSFYPDVMSPHEAAKLFREPRRTLR
jgi:hypothetical protein